MYESAYQIDVVLVNSSDELFDYDITMTDDDHTWKQNKNISIALCSNRKQCSSYNADYLVFLNKSEGDRFKCPAAYVTNESRPNLSLYRQ